MAMIAADASRDYAAPPAAWDGLPLDGLPAAALDTETTGLMPGVHEVCELALVVCAAAGELRWQTLVSGRFEAVSPEALALHGIDLAEARRGPTAAEAAARAKALLAAAAPVGVLLVHNAQFDLAMLEPPAGGIWPWPVLDTSALARALLGVDESLSRLLARHGIARDGPAHRALSDALAVLALWERALRPQLPADATVGDALRIAAAAPPSRRYRGAAGTGTGKGGLGDGQGRRAAGQVSG